ncbi:MAG: amidohydrolase [Rhodobacterales bacterium]|nr:MAG: amidohydrolase [Rhodobacterales bacterium]
MAVINRIAAFAQDMKTWRRHLHAHPEIGFDCHETADFVARQLRSFGVDELHTGIAQTGLVAIINGHGAGPTIGLRADMDALPMDEATGLDHASTYAGKMHACGHDGHTTMLLGAARYLAETRKFSGRVALIFQPAEEGGAGGKVMCDEGIMERFDIAQVYALHNLPDLPLGVFSTTPGPIMAAADDFFITVTGKGGHGAFPQETIDPIPAAVALVTALQTIVTRNIDAAHQLVLSVTQIQAGSATNIIPETASISGTVRSFDKAVQAMVQERMQQICDGISGSYGVKVDLNYQTDYPPTINDANGVAIAAAAAGDVVGADQVITDQAREMGAEDFSFMLEKRPGAYLFLGQGPGAALHHPAYDFNDEIAPLGASFFARLVEMQQPLAES